MADNTQYKERVWLWGLLFAGVLFRLIHYFQMRSLWLDEALVALRTEALSFQQILLNAVFDPDLPVHATGFLAVEKLVIQAWGGHEAAFRFFPLLAGVVGLGVFLSLLRRICRPGTAVTAMALMACSPALIYYAAETKPYAVDVLVALLLYNAVFSRQRLPASLLPWITAGWAALTFSTPAVFILASAGLVWGWEAIHRRDEALLRRVLLISVFWALGFVFWYRALYHEMLGSQVILDGSKAFFLPRPLWSLAAAHWLGERFLHLFTQTLGLKPGWLYGGAFLLGVAALRKDPRKAFLLLAPLCLAALAACLRKFPFHERFLLFASPGLLVVLAEGMAFWARRIPGSPRGKAVLLGVLFLLPPAIAAVSGAWQGYGQEESRSLVSVLRSSWQADDQIYVNDMGRHALLYYLRGGDPEQRPKTLRYFSDHFVTDAGERKILMTESSPVFDEGCSCFVGSRDFGDIVARSIKEPHLFGSRPRTWIFLTHTKTTRAFVLNYLDQHGQQRGAWSAKGAELYLYDMCSPAEASRE